jgi:hypothetical protein
MGIYARNHEPNINDEFEVRIRHEFVGGLLVPSIDKVITVPARKRGDFYWYWLVANAPHRQRSWMADDADVIALPARETPPHECRRILGAWGTEPDNSELVRQVQTDRIVQYRGGYTFDPDLDPKGGFGTDGKWIRRSAHGGFPPGLCAAVYFRPEALRIRGNGLAQINIASRTYEGTTNDHSMSFRAQAKGHTAEGQPCSSSRNRCAVSRLSVSCLFKAAQENHAPHYRSNDHDRPKYLRR